MRCVINFIIFISLIEKLIYMLIKRTKSCKTINIYEINIIFHVQFKKQIKCNRNSSKMLKVLKILLLNIIVTFIIYTSKH